MELGQNSLCVARVEEASTTMVNIPGVLAVASALRRPGILRPHISVHCRLPSLTQHLLRSTGTRCMRLAFVSSCSTRTTAWYALRLIQTRPYDDHLVPALQHSWEECKRIFGSENILLVSNSAGTRSDPHGIAAENVSSELGVPVLLHASKKPGKACAKQIVDYFDEMVQRGRHPDTIPHVLVVGDRTTTDVVLASRIGRLLSDDVRATDSDTAVSTDDAPRLPLCSSMLTTQLWAPEKLGTRFMRGTENRVLKALIRCGIPPGGGWRTRSHFVSPAWLQDLPEPVPATPPEPTPRSIVLSAVASCFPPRLVRFLRSFARIGLRFMRIRRISRGMRALRSGWRIMVQEVFRTVRKTRTASWSLLTNAPTEGWTSTWRTRRPTVFKDGMIPPMGSLRSGKRSRMFSTCTAAQVAERAPHERPVRRRTPQEAASHLPPSEPPMHTQRTSLFGIGLRQWLMALAALIILPTGFIGGIKLNDAITQWKGGDLSNEGHAENMEDFATPRERDAMAADMANDTAAETSKKIQEYVFHTNPDWSATTSS